MNLTLPSDRILIIDDCPEDIAELSNILDIYGYSVQVLSDGISALHASLPVSYTHLTLPTICSV